MTRRKRDAKGEAKVLGVLPDGLQLTIGEIAKRIGYPRPNVVIFVRRLVEDGKLEPTTTVPVRHFTPMLYRRQSGGAPAVHVDMGQMVYADNATTNHLPHCWWAT